MLFDLDHTLLDSHASESMAYRATLEGVGVGDPDAHFAVYDRINRELWAAVEAGTIGPDDVRVSRFERLIAERHLDADPQAMADRFVAGLGAYGELYEGAEDLLRRLGGFARLGLVTNGIGEVQRARIERLGIESSFSTIVISGEVGTAKPGTAIFDIAFARLGNPPLGTTLMVGDSLTSDIAGGINYGIATCWYNPPRNGSPPKPSPRHIHPTYEVSDLLAIETIVTADAVR